MKSDIVKWGNWRFHGKWGKKRFWPSGREGSTFLMKLGYVLLEHLFGVIHVLFRFSTLKNKFVKIVFPKTLKKCFRKHILCFRKYVITRPKIFILGANSDSLKIWGNWR